MPTQLVPRRTRFPTTFRRMEEEMSDLMTRFFGRTEAPWNGGGVEFLPAADVAETDKGYEITMDLPGINPKDLTVEIREGSLCVSGERKAAREEKGKTYCCCERAEGRFNRVIPLDLPVDRDKVEARYHDGVLTITVAKKAGAETKRIEIKT